MPSWKTPESKLTVENEVTPELLAILDKAGLEIVLRVIRYWLRENGGPRTWMSVRLNRLLRDYIEYKAR